MKKLEVNSPEFRELVGKLTDTKLSLPKLTTTASPLPKITTTASPLPKTTTTSSPLPKITTTVSPLPKITTTASTTASPLPKITTTNPPLPKLPSSSSTFTGIKDVDLLILMELDDDSLFQTCKVNKYIQKLCKDENFWRNRFQNRYGVLENKDADKTWKNMYLLHVEEEKGINLYWRRRGKDSRFLGGDVPEFYLDMKKYKKDKSVLIIPNVYKNLRNDRNYVFGLYNVNTDKLVSPLFVNEQEIKKYWSENFKDRIDLSMFKISKPSYPTHWKIFHTGETGLIGTEPTSIKLPKLS